MSSDGKWLILRATSSDTGEDIVVLSMEGEHKIEPLLHTKFNERNAALSPDGRWMAYQSNESGSFEVYVRPFPQVDTGRWQISAGGGGHPLWARFYLVSDGTLMSVPVHPGAGFAVGNVTRVLDASAYNSGIGGRNYDVSPDGQRFLMIKDDQQQGAAHINVVLNWFEELKRLVPTK